MMEDRDVLKGLEKVLDSLEVLPDGDGDYVIQVQYKTGHVIDAKMRAFFAVEIAELLHRRIGKLRSRRK